MGTDPLRLSVGPSFVCTANAAEPIVVVEALLMYKNMDRSETVAQLIQTEASSLFPVQRRRQKTSFVGLTFLTAVTRSRGVCF